MQARKSRNSRMLESSLKSLHRMLSSTMAASSEPDPQPCLTATLDQQRMATLARWTARTLATPHPVPFAAEIVRSANGQRLMRALNAVARQNDPSAHAELRTVRRACRKLGSYSLRGYTLYSTCEPCPMCMANALWAGLDRVVYGATIADANRFCRQIRIPATEIAERSDMSTTVVIGPVCRDECLALFTHPKMQQAFKTWSTAREVPAAT
jgi:tRNA(adenine34) deaminase